MPKSRLGKRERAAVNAPRDAIKAKIAAVVAVNMAGPRPDRALLTRGGSSDSVANLMGRTHQDFRDNLHNGRDRVAINKDPTKLIDPAISSLGRSVMGREGWKAQAPLPNLSRSELLSLERGHKIAPTGEAQQPSHKVYPTAPALKRFGKTK